MSDNPQAFYFYHQSYLQNNDTVIDRMHIFRDKST